MYKLQNLLTRDVDGKVVGPMSPTLAAKEMVKSHDFNSINGLVRVWNDKCSSGYDHLLIKVMFPDTSYFVIFFADMGVNLLPIALYDSKEDSAIFTPVYKENITTEAMKQHRADCEINTRYGEEPIIVINEKQFLKLIKQTIKEDSFKILDYEGSGSGETA